MLILTNVLYGNRIGTFKPVALRLKNTDIDTEFYVVCYTYISLHQIYICCRKQNATKVTVSEPM